MLNINMFPYAFMANNLAMTALMIVCGLAGRSELTADIAIIHAITVAVFNSFSANGRNLILRDNVTLGINQLLFYRFSLLIPLSAMTLLLAVLSKVNIYIAIIFLVRKIAEWLDELFLSEMERINRKKAGLTYFIIQVALVLFAGLWLTNEMPHPLFGATLWAIFPLLLSFKFYKNILITGYQPLIPIIRSISPHLGSTAVIGISVYVFRLVLIDFLGKMAASDLFVAFSMGGILGSLIANAFGPTIALNQRNNQSNKYPVILKWLMFIFFIAGLLLTCASSTLSTFYKSTLFWSAIGLSMMGALPMVWAQITRHRLLQTHLEHDLFGPDVLMNVLLISAIPLIYFLLGHEYLPVMYLLSSTMALVFYKSYESYEVGKFELIRSVFSCIKPVLICLLIFPVFFQLDLTIFSSENPLFDSHGELSKLPMPLSIIANFVIMIGIGAYSRSHSVLSFIFFSFVLMSLAIILNSSSGSLAQQSKFIQLAQFTLPMFALITGRGFELDKRSLQLQFEKTFFYSILVIVSLQLFASLIHGSHQLLPSVYIFSIYQYLHYVPFMLIICYMFIFVHLWSTKSRYSLVILWFLLSTYSLMSSSLFLIMICTVAMTAYVFLYPTQGGGRNTFMKTGLVILVFGLLGMVVHDIRETNIADSRSVQLNTIYSQARLEWQDKSQHWTSYVNHLKSDSRSLLFGDKDNSFRERTGSAHNYYLDFVYNFGLIGILPLLMLIVITAYRTYRAFEGLKLDSYLLFPLLSLMMILLIENNYSMALKQPYPGTLSFFLWGIYLSRLNIKNK